MCHHHVVEHHLLHITFHSQVLSLVKLISCLHSQGSVCSLR
jgi:hypothetical protein